MASNAYSMTETQIGAIGESLVTTGLIIGSGGRLSPFQAVADDGGIDLLVYDKATGRGIPLQVKTRTKTLNASPHVCHFQLRRATFRELQDGLLLAVLIQFAPTGPAVQRAWLVPMNQLNRLARVTADKLVIRPSKSATSKDRLSPYRHESLEGVANQLIARFDILAGRRPRKSTARARASAQHVIK